MHLNLKKSGFDYVISFLFIIIFTNQLFAKGLASEEAKEAAVTNAESGAAACNAAKAQVEVNQASLERTQLIAPFGGIVAEIEGELGEYVTPSPVGVATKPTLDLIDNTCIYIKAPIDEIDAPEVIKVIPQFLEFV